MVHMGSSGGVLVIIAIKVTWVLTSKGSMILKDGPFGSI